MTISQKMMKQLFGECEIAFEKCWNTLVRLKNITSKDTDLVIELISFQETLATPLFELQKIRNKISERERKLILKKTSLKLHWFKANMKCLANYRKGIDHVINIGKGIGDAFAYFFYRNDLDILEKQFFHKRINNFVSGTGGIGELHFLKNMKHLDGKLTLYHGITNTLRFGDFSFYDLQKRRITEIGELKTKKLEGNQYELVLTAIATETTSEPITGSLQASTKLDQRTEDNLRRQVDAIVEMLSPEKGIVKYNSTVTGSFFCEELEKIYTSAKVNQNTVSKISPGLLFASARLPRSTLYTQIFKRKLDKLTRELPDKSIDGVRSLIKESSQNNSIILGQLLYYNNYEDKNKPGTVPLFWYPLSDNLLKDLYFTNFIVFTVYNPAYLIDNLISKGYNISSKYNSTKIKKGNKVLEHFDLLISFAMNHLQSEDSIINSIEQVNDLSIKKKLKGKITFRPQMKFESLFGLVKTLE